MEQQATNLRPPPEHFPSRTKYVYDPFGRLTGLKNQSNATVAEYSYFGNGFRASEHYDVDLSGTVDGSDPTYYFAWDEQWRLSGVYRGSDASPKERFLHHQAGNSGFGLSSYIDDLFLRDRDANTAWSSASDGTLEQRRYYCQNWRHDVVAIVTDTGVLAERVRYSAYGIPFGIPAGDATGDGITNGADSAVVYGNWGNPTPIAADFNLDGTIDGGDYAVILGNWLVTLGRGKLSNIGNRFGYAGYESDFATDLLMHVRHRAYHTMLGRWLRRDPEGYRDSTNLYEYVAGVPMRDVDPSGTATLIAEHTTRFASKCVGGCTFKFTAYGVPADCKPVLVQQVDNDLMCRACCNNKCQHPYSVWPTTTYWESFTMTADPSTPGRYVSQEDTARWPVPGGTCGEYTQTGRLYLFCQKDFDALGIPDPLAGWTTTYPGVVVTVGAAPCGNTVSSWYAPGTGSQPIWWLQVHSIASAQRTAKVSWECNCNAIGQISTCSP